MISGGVWPAAVTPMTPEGAIDWPGLARLLAHFEAEGCAGVVLAGTNGEGPSLSTVEKRDLLRESQAMKGRLGVILGLATCSLSEAQWLASQAGKWGADGLLALPPFFFRSASDKGIEAWLATVLDFASCPVLVYENPAACGVSLSSDCLERLAMHPMCGGLKDSSGATHRLDELRQIFTGSLFVGNETLIPQVRAAGWSGTISGCANAIPRWLVESWADDVKHTLALPAIQALKAAPQPALNKALLHRMGILLHPTVRLPLTPADPDSAAAEIEGRLGPVFAPR